MYQIVRSYWDGALPHHQRECWHVIQYSLYSFLLANSLRVLWHALPIVLLSHHVICSPFTLMFCPKYISSFVPVLVSHCLLVFAVCLVRCSYVPGFHAIVFCSLCFICPVSSSTLIFPARGARDYHGDPCLVPVSCGISRLLHNYHFLCHRKKAVLGQCHFKKNHYTNII